MGSEDFDIRIFKADELLYEISEAEVMTVCKVADDTHARARAQTPRAHTHTYTHMHTHIHTHTLPFCGIKVTGITNRYSYI